MKNISKFLLMLIIVLAGFQCKNQKEIEPDEGVMIKNQQNASHIYSDYPIGWIKFSSKGRHKIKISLSEGDRETASLASIKFSPIEF